MNEDHAYGAFFGALLTTFILLFIYVAADQVACRAELEETTSELEKELEWKTRPVATTAPVSSVEPGPTAMSYMLAVGMAQEKSSSAPKTIETGKNGSPMTSPGSLSELPSLRLPPTTPASTSSSSMLQSHTDGHLRSVSLAEPFPERMQRHPTEPRTIIQVERIDPFRDNLERAAYQYNVPADVLHAIAAIEHSNTNSVSKAGAYGLCQTMPNYWTPSEWENRHDVQTQLITCARALRDKKDVAGEGATWRHAAARYFGGSIASPVISEYSGLGTLHYLARFDNAMALLEYRND